MVASSAHHLCAKYLNMGSTILVALALALLLALASTVEAYYSYSSIRATATRASPTRVALTNSPPRPCSSTVAVVTTTAKAAMSPRHNHHLHRYSLVAFGSLRDLVEPSSGNNNNADKNEGKYYDGADDFNNLLNFSRSKFADTKLRSRENTAKVSGTGSGSDEDDERGLHSDRLSTFSFATNAPKSQSQGGGVSTVDLDNTSDIEDGSTRNTLQEEIPPSALRRTNILPEDYAADNFNSMVGTFYSKQKFPSREKSTISDDIDERGLHSDRLSTFSFSSANIFSFATRSPKSQSEGLPGNLDDDDEEVAGDMMVEDVLGFDEDEIGVGDDTALPIANIDDGTMPADDFNSMVGTFYSKQKFPSREKGKFADDIDEMGLHGDRLSTFSFSSSQPKLKTTSNPLPPMSDVDAEPDEILSRSDRTFGFPTRQTSTTNEDIPTVTPSVFNTVNHNDRLGTFSFASTDPRSGSTSSKGTSASSPLASTSDSKTTPPQPRPKESSNQAQYTSPQKGSLSSIASSVYIKSRNDRIKDIKEATDPKLLHPDGMNVPRLNSKGDVMTLSNTGGRLNIFQRIGNVKQGSDEVTSAVADYDQDGHGDCFIGFDLGTSGARMSIVERKIPSSGEAKKWKYVELVTEALAWNDEMQYDNANDWKAAVHTLLSRVRGDEVMTRVKAICVSGTSASCLLLNRYSLDVARSARMYNYDILSSSDSADDNSPARRVMKIIDKYVPDKHTARATSGSLAKLLLWNEVKPMVDEEGEVKEVICHQSDYISMSLMWDGLVNDDKKCRVVSDWHNCLKLGYDVRRLEFPSWMYQLLEEGANISDPESVLPSKVVSPGEPIGVISPIVASTYGLSSNVVIVGGTTDSNAAFFASAGTKPDFGTSVTSLGSTLAIKQLSKTFVEDASRGVYSHRFPIFGNGGNDKGAEEEAWLIGGASNVGCAILRQEGFSNEELRTLSEEIDPNSDCKYQYYPLTKKGERFPVADSTKEPVLTPKPDSRKDYLHGILQGIGDVEREGYRVLGELGADPKRPTVVLTAGGGAANNVWMSLRERRLQDICGDDNHNIEVARANSAEASYGAALLAAASFENAAMPSSPENSKYDKQENYIN
jgi:sugar (pentulose or hexulose) kinase